MGSLASQGRFGGSPFWSAPPLTAAPQAQAQDGPVPPRQAAQVQRPLRVQQVQRPPARAAPIASPQQRRQ